VATFFAKADGANTAFNQPDSSGKTAVIDTTVRKDNTFYILPVDQTLSDTLLRFRNQPNPLGNNDKNTLILPCTSVVKIVLLDVARVGLDSAWWDKLPAGTYQLWYDWTGYRSGKYYYKLTACDTTVTIQHLFLK
jgi:hypothetical protein